MQRVRAGAVPENATEYPAFMDVCSFESCVEQGSASLGDIALAAIAEGVILGAADEGRHAAVGKAFQVFEAEGDQLRSAAEGVVTDRNQRSVSLASEVIWTRFQESIAQVGGEAEGLGWSSVA